MPASIDQIVKMKNSGMQWQCYDVMYIQKRGKRIARGSKKVSGWATLDVVLYLECQAGKLYGRQVGLKGLTQRTPMGLTTSQAPARWPYISTQSDEKAPPHLSMAFPYTPIHVGGSRGRGVMAPVPGHKNTFLLFMWGRAHHQGLSSTHGQHQCTAPASPPALSSGRRWSPGTFS